MSSSRFAFEVTPEAPSEVLDWMKSLSPDATGWVVLQPGISPETPLPSKPGILAMFGTQSPDVPVCTWIPGKIRHGIAAPVSIGIAHHAGQRALPVLAGAGIALPAGWRVAQDHPRRGLVLRVPPDAPDTEVLTWIFAAGRALTPVPLTGDWLVTVFRRSGKRRSS